MMASDSGECAGWRWRKELPMRTKAKNAPFFGWKVMWAAFTLAVFGWGVGFYGPPVFLHTLVETRGWSVRLVSAAITVHFLFGAVFIANMPALYARFGVPRTTNFSALCLALGVFGWSVAGEPWHLFAATIVSAFGWAGMGAVAVNTIIAPWFVKRRPAALSTAYNGASVGGVLFSPLWVFLIAWCGFPVTAAAIGTVMILCLWVLSNRYFSVTPRQLGVTADGEISAGTPPAEVSETGPAFPGYKLWLSRAFLTCTAGFAIGLFVQIGVIAHLFSLLVPALGPEGAGLTAGLATACAILGRSLVGWFLPTTMDRRIAAAINYAVQAVGCAAFVLANGDSVPLLLLGTVLFGLGIGNVTSLPPLILHQEFSKADVFRAIALSTAITQALFAFAPAIFGLLREGESAGAPSGDVSLLFIFAATAQMIAAGAYLAGRK